MKMEFGIMYTKLVGVRQIEPITGGPFIFSNIEDKYRWFYRDGVLKREDDFYTKSEINEMISGWDVSIQDALKSLEEIKGVNL